jgi:hypothetical protein
VPADIAAIPAVLPARLDTAWTGEAYMTLTDFETASANAALAHLRIGDTDTRLAAACVPSGEAAPVPAQPASSTATATAMAIDGPRYFLPKCQREMVG